MQNLTVTLLLLATLLFSCKKSETELPQLPEPETESESFNWEHTPGSYWVYQWYRIDSTGNETLLNTTDSMVVIGDTIINGHSYTAFNSGEFLLPSKVVYQRDSSGYIVNHLGGIKFSYMAFNDTVNTKEIPGLYKSYGILGPSMMPISVPAGDFDAYQKREAFELIEGVPPITCADTLGFDTYYDANTGLPLLQQGAFSAEYHTTCVYFERRLIEFHIAE